MKFAGKTYQSLQDAQQIYNIGKTLTNEDATSQDKTLAGTQGLKMLNDLALKKAGQKTASQIAQSSLKSGTKEFAKLTGKQAVSAGLGSVVGGYSMVTGAKEAGSAWEEEDYDEAILHGISSASGALQMAGGGMMATGIGAPIGAVLFGIGQAGSVISGAGLFLEGLFGGGEGSAPVPAKTPNYKSARVIRDLKRQNHYDRFRR